MDYSIFYAAITLTGVITTLLGLRQLNRESDAQAFYTEELKVLYQAMEDRSYSERKFLDLDYLVQGFMLKVTILIKSPKKGMLISILGFLTLLIGLALL